MRLLAHYYEPANVMHGHLTRALKYRSGKNRISKRKQREEHIYLQLWLATLAVTCEGFRDRKIEQALEAWKYRPAVFKGRVSIAVHCDSISHMLSQHGRLLHRFRNATFHFQESPSKHLEFLFAEGGHPPLLWAEVLHQEFATLFHTYFIERQFAYALQEKAAGRL